MDNSSRPASHNIFVSGMLALVAAFTALPSSAQAPGQPSAYIHIECDRNCLIGFMREYMQALARRDISKARFSRDVRFTENSVEIPLGNEGLWGTVTGVAANGLEAADPSTGQAAWFGTAEENGQPVYFAARIKVSKQQIVEVETVVTRKVGLPLPFGDVSKVVHDPEFAEVLPQEQRRPRERLIAVADSYFSTVELNDGMVFAPFTEDCARLENGLMTTKAGAGAGAIAQGCEDQFKLGMYRINKRVRRHFPLVDEERGVVVAAGFFDHANTFSTYKTTDGKDRKTLLQWPNTISLLEAFKIKDGRIHRIEAVFDYVPYFMHSPWVPVQAPPPWPEPKKPASGCDRECLTGFASRYMDALVQQKPEQLPWSERVRFTENSVPMMVGDAQWGSIRKKSDSPLLLADPVTGDAFWLGIVHDHDTPAYFAVRLKVLDGRIAEVEHWAARKQNPGPFGEPASYRNDAVFTEVVNRGKRTPASRLKALAEEYLQTADRASGVTVRENGQALKEPPRKMDRLRNSRVLLTDEERGIVITTSFADYASRERGPEWFPSSRERLHIFKVRDGRIQKIEAVSVYQPYGMPSQWR
jgi:hypothetical protein